MSTGLILSEIITIDNGRIILNLAPQDAATLAVACARAREHTIEIVEENLGVTLTAFAGLFKAAAIAASCQGWMTDDYRERAGREAERLLVVRGD